MDNYDLSTFGGRKPSRREFLTTSLKQTLSEKVEICDQLIAAKSEPDWRKREIVEVKGEARLHQLDDNEEILTELLAKKEQS